MAESLAHLSNAARDELRANAARLRTALETARQVAWESSPVGVRCSHTATAVLGLTLSDGFVAEAVWEACIHGDDRAGRQAIIAGARKQGGGQYQAEFRWQRPDNGAVIWVEEHGRFEGPDAPGAAADVVAGSAVVSSGMVADITARKTAEIERARFFTLGLDLMVVGGFDGYLKRVGPAWERALGWTAAELTAQPWLSFVHPDDHAATIAEGAKLFSGIDSASFENRYRCKDGSWRWLSWKIKTFPEERLLYGAASDVSERKRREERDAFLIALDDAIRPVAKPEEIMRIASQMLGRHLRVDRCAHSAFESDGDTVVVTTHDMRDGLAPIGRRVSMKAFGSEVRRCLEANRPAMFSDVMSDAGSAEGRDEYLRLGIRAHLAVPLIKDGRIAAAWGLHQATPRVWQPDEVELLRRVADRCWEATARAGVVAAMRGQWQLFDSALSHTPDFTYIFDLDGRFVYINRALLSLWQKPFAQAVGKNFHELEYPPELAERLQRQIQLVISTRDIVRDHTPFTGANGVPRHYEYIFVPVFGDQGEITGVAGSTRDITDRLQIEAELRAANDKLGQSNRELEQFAYMASHDLQEPLRMVSSFVSLLERRAAGGLDDAARTYIARAKDGTARMQVLIRDLLTYAKLGEQRPFAAVELSKVVEIAREHLAMRIEDAQAVVTAEGLPAVMGDELRLVQLFQNLIGNAIKFRSPERAPRVHISAREAVGAWMVTVSDNGIGIAEGERQRIFEVFYRGDQVDAYEGTGIGLAICKKIVEQHGGGIALASEVGVGSKFIVRFPKPLP